MRPAPRWAAVAVALGVTFAGCSGAATVPTAGSQPTTTAAQARGSASSGSSPLAEAVAAAQEAGRKYVTIASRVLTGK